MVTRFDAGLADGEDGHAAGVSAARAALDGLDGNEVDFCQLFVADHYEYRAVIDGVRSVIGERAELVGCSTAGEFTHRGVGTDGVAVALLRSDEMRVFTGLGTGLTADVAGAVREAVREFPASVDGFPHQSAIMLHDGLSGVGEQLSVLTKQKLGPQVRLVGGSAGDGMSMERTFVFRGETVADDAVALVLLASKQPVAVGIDHATTPLSEPMTVTRSAGSVVHELDGRPAFDVWKETVREHAARTGYDVDAIDPGSAELTKLLTRYEFGIDQGGSYKNRWPGLTSTTEGPMRFVLEIPEGTVFRVMQSPIDEQGDVLRRAGRAALDGLDGEPAGALVYDCACRSVILDGAFSDAVDQFAAEIGVPFAGFEAYGEVCMEHGQTSGYHNTTAVVMVLPR